jgi:ribosomal protein S18 acetylase RimI-like enzyme
VKIEEIKGMPNHGEIIDLINAVWPAEFGEKTEREKIKHMQEHHNLETDTVKYLLDGKEIVGFYRCSRWPGEDPRSRAAHLLDIAVLPAHHSRGLGKRLMKDVIRDCAEKGIEQIYSRSFKTNQRSVRFHRSLGFNEYKTTADSIVRESAIGKP